MTGASNKEVKLSSSEVAKRRTDENHRPVTVTFLSDDLKWLKMTDDHLTAALRMYFENHFGKSLLKRIPRVSIPPM